MDLQHIDVKALVDAPRGLNLDPFLAIFGRWRNDKSHPADWVDVADYAHMSQGAGVILVGKQGTFGVTRFDPGLGLHYSGRKDYQGSYEERVLESFRRHLSLTAALLQEPEYPPAMKTFTGQWELALNDRLDFPNTEETDRLLRPEIKTALDKLFGTKAYDLTAESDPQRRYGFTIRTRPSTDLNPLLDAVARAR